VTGEPAHLRRDGTEMDSLLFFSSSVSTCLSWISTGIRQRILAVLNDTLTCNQQFKGNHGAGGSGNELEVEYFGDLILCFSC